jgi:hypothetical protein
MELNQNGLGYLVKPLHGGRAKPETPDPIAQTVTPMSHAFHTAPTQKSTEEPVDCGGWESRFLNDVRHTDLVTGALKTIQYLKGTTQNRALCALPL